ncbi:MAG: acylphosphatase [Thermoplasmata archaeon]|nr:acylphosphatase [Thermoplasmata archaeon]
MRVEMKLRYTIRITGDVQSAGYRAAVQRIARGMKVTGYVENLEDSEVKVVAEGEKAALEDFRKAIRIRAEHIRVEGMRTRKGKATGEFKGFRVNVTDIASEMFQGYATAEKYFSSLGGDVKALGGDVRAVGGDVRAVGQKVDTLTEHTDAHFASLEEKYHMISEILRSMNESSQIMQREFIRTREELSRVVDSLVTLVREGRGGKEARDVA